AAKRIAEVAMLLRGRGVDPHEVAHFLDRIVFCFFAEDIGLLPSGLFTELLDEAKGNSPVFAEMVGDLFAKMATGGRFGPKAIRHFNGNLFNGGAVLELTGAELDALRKAAHLDWSAVDASIFGTLFERGMDPAKRAQLGAHYTSREDIETLVEPVVMTPLRREWAETRRVVESLLATGKKDGAVPPDPPKLSPPVLKKARLEADALLHRYLERLAQVKVLDPACGSGNFLYVTLQKLKDLEKEVILFAMDHGYSAYLPAVGPWQLYGIEVNAYAHDLAQMTVWIGYLQWTHANGFAILDNPVLRPMEHNFLNMDAILDLTDPAQPKEPEWPAVDYIVGNPPFLGDKLMRGELGDDYVNKLRKLFNGRIPGQSDLCCYWFEKARVQLVDGKCLRAGLLATQGIRGGANREVLKRIKETGDIFFAESDRVWVLDGANVHVSMVGFDGGNEKSCLLDGNTVSIINTNLQNNISDNANLTDAKPLSENATTCYLGVMKAGAFDIPESLAREMLCSPNPHGLPNSNVLRPRLNAKDLLHRSACGWIIDFGCSTAVADASLYEEPWEYIETNVKPERENNRRPRLAKEWWIHGEPRPGLRKVLTGLTRFIVTPEVSKHRIFAWLDAVYLADHQTRAFARSDDYSLGVLHSRIHEVWALAQGTQLREKESGFRYTPTTCFETFPFPRPTAAQEAAIAAAAKELDTLRTGWLNPPEWMVEEVLEFPGAADGPWARYVHAPDARGIGTVRYPRRVGRDAAHREMLAKRTLTNLYNQRPAWLALAHQTLDAAVFAAYGWDPALSDDALLAHLLALNLERAAEE
ncbi:MAG: class I SAM-dependent DNA methyltransferase, partial [Armatimonadota bacterium]